jgi:uncharacterized phage-associated protein
MVSAHDVARELRERLSDAGDLKVHKLLYYCQGWHLAWAGEPMFAEPVEAWTNGPVVADLWHDEKRARVPPGPKALDDLQLATVEYVVRRYGRQSGQELVRMTHVEDPWRDVSEREDTGAVPNPQITHEALADWFGSDEEGRAHRAAVAKLRQQHDIYGFEGDAMPEGLRQTTLRVLAERS